MNKRKLGQEYEKKAADFLRLQGMEILESNYRNRFGEVDLIARCLEPSPRFTLVFVEVKYRKSTNYGYPVEAVNRKKQKVIVKVAWYYLKTHGYSYGQGVRFDVVTICDDKIHHLENAFEGYDL